MSAPRLFGMTNQPTASNTATAAPRTLGCFKVSSMSENHVDSEAEDLFFGYDFAMGVGAGRLEYDEFDEEPNPPVDAMGDE